MANEIKGSLPMDVVPNLKAQWWEVIIVMVAQLGNLWRLYQLRAIDWMLFFPMLWVVDFCSGAYHWWADSYRTPYPAVNGVFFDNFQIHHRRPNVICQKHWCNVSWEVSVMAFVATFFPGYFAAPHSGWGPAFWTFAVLWSSLTNQAHRWAHMSPRKVPILAKLAQRTGILLSPEHHRLHHKYPQLDKYCITCGACNFLLDYVDFWRKTESFIFNVFGIPCWSMVYADKDRFATHPFVPEVK